MAILSRSSGLPVPAGWKRWLRAWAVLVLVSCFPVLRLSAQVGPTREYQVKAVFLFNFAQFVEWPTNAFLAPNAPLIIGVLGDDPYDGFLDDTVRGEKINDHPLIVQRYRNVEDIKACHVLFISRSEAGQFPQILKSLRGRGILTVGDAEGFDGRGGMIRFVTAKGKIRLRINVDAARSENMIISSRLLKLAEIVYSGKD